MTATTVVVLRSLFVFIEEDVGAEVGQRVVIVGLRHPVRLHIFLSHLV